MARSSLEYSPTLVEDSGENQADEQMTERHFMPVLTRLPSVILAALSYIVVMVTCLVLVYGASVQPLARFMSALSDTREWKTWYSCSACNSCLKYPFPVQTYTHQCLSYTVAWNLATIRATPPTHTDTHTNTNYIFIHMHG